MGSTSGADLVVRVAGNIEGLQASMATAATSVKTFETDVKASTSTLTGMQNVARDLATDLAAMFTVRAAFNFVKDIIDGASALKDLSQQTHINVEELQLLAGGMSEFGVDADTLGKALYKLSRGIAGGDDSIAHGLHLMGMSMKDLDGLNGKELFLKIEGGLATLQGGLRDTAAADLFGGKLGAAMAGASEGIEGALETWQRLNHVASTESVDALDEFGEAITRANKNLTAIAANMIGPVAQGFNTINSAVDRGASKWSVFGAMMHDLWDSGWGKGDSAAHLATLLDHLNQKTDQNTKSTAGATSEHKKAVEALDAHGQAIAFMAALEADAAVKLDATQIKNLEHLKEIGALNAKNAEGIGVSAAQYAKYTASVEAATKAETARKALLKEVHDVEAMNNAFSLKGFEEINQVSATANAHRMAEMTAGYASIKSATLALADDVAKSTLTTTDYQIKKIWDVVASEKAAFVGSLEQRAQFNTAVEALANRQADVIIAAARRAEAAALTIAVGGGGGFNQGQIPNTGKLTGVTSSTSDYIPPYVPPTVYTQSLVGLPGFAEGGPVLRDGPIYAHAGETVVPKGGGGAGGGTTVIQLHLDGKVVAQVVHDHHTKAMKQSRQWPSA
jgi:hypothetical protein